MTEELKPIDVTRFTVTENGNVIRSKTMNKEKIDEIKNKISMELQNPITQQGFEIICKHILELQKDKGVLTDKVADLEKQIEKMKCCGNCKYLAYDYEDMLCSNKKHCKNYNLWKLKEIKEK